MRLRVLAVGKLPAALEAACEPYVKRSRALLPVERLTCKDNAAALAKARAGHGRVVVLDERGDAIGSEALAAWLGALRDEGVRDVSFVLGDAHGFSEHDRARADRVLSLSAMTLPHRLAQLVLVEQLYRAGTILAGHPYHH